jgi:hypothetical protein
MVPGSVGCGVADFAATTMLAPRAARARAMARPMPREAPELAPPQQDERRQTQQGKRQHSQRT